jgi:hypothetical protein
MRHTVIAIAALGIAGSATACSTGAPGAQPSDGRAVTDSWTVASCQVDVTYIDETNTVEYYLPDTDANFRQHYADNKVSGDAGLAVVITFVNNTGRPAPLPIGPAVSFTDRSGTDVGSPLTFNNTNGTGYGRAVANGRGSGEAFSSSTLFNPAEKVAESPDLGLAVPQEPDLNCQASQQ